MKIKYFHHGLWPSNSPSPTFVTFNAYGFYKNKYDFELIITRNSQDSKTYILKNQFGVEDDVPVHQINAGWFRRQHIVVSLLAFFYLWKSDYDILITRNLSFLPFALLLRKIKKINVIFESHDFFTDFKLRGITKEKKKNKQRRQELRYIPKVDGVICVSEMQKQYYEKYYPEQKFLTAVTGIKTHKDYPVKTIFSYKIGYIGSLKSRDYDLSFLISMFARVKNPDVKLVIAGAKNQNDIKKIRTYISKYELDNRVQILSWLPPEKVDELKQEIDIGCAPMVVNPRSRMCSPLKVLEYLSAGIPVIGTNLEGIEYIIKNNVNGFTLENDETRWAAAIESLYSDIEKYRAFSRECLKSVQKFSWEQRAQTIYHFLSDKFFKNESRNIKY